MTEEKLSGQESERKIVLDIFNFHEIFRGKKFKEGDMVKGLRECDSWDVIIRTEEEPAYRVIGISQNPDGTILERTYACYEHIVEEIIREHRRNSLDWEHYNNQLKELRK